MGQVLRVVNDDLVMPQNGFGRHPHRDMVHFGCHSISTEFMSAFAGNFQLHS
jgi:hypothetical protein